MITIKNEAQIQRMREAGALLHSVLEELKTHVRPGVTTMQLDAMAEKMITIGKAGDLHSKRQVLSYVTKEDVAKKLFDEIAPKYADRNGGYTKIVKIGPRRGDAAEMAIIELV